MLCPSLYLFYINYQIPTIPHCFKKIKRPIQRDFSLKLTSFVSPPQSGHEPRLQQTRMRGRARAWISWPLASNQLLQRATNLFITRRWSHLPPYSANQPDRICPSLRSPARCPGRPFTASSMSSSKQSSL